MKNKKNIKDLEEERYGLFMNDNSYDLEILYGRHYLETDVKFIIGLYRINLLSSKSNNLYGQSKPNEKKYLPKIKLNVMVNIEDGNQTHYGEDDGSLVRDDSGNIVIGVYLKELEEKKVEINRGDIIVYNLSGEKDRYYEVTDANNVYDTTSKTIAGFNSYWKEIIATPVKEDVTKFLNDV